MAKSNYSKNKAPLSKRKERPETGLGQHRLYTGQEEKRKFHDQAGVAVCRTCGAICFEKHWFLAAGKEQEILKGHQVRNVLCPGCAMVEEQNYQGEVILDSPFLIKEKGAIIGLIKHIEGKCWHDSPQSRIAAMVDQGDRMEIRTTTTWLATQIGKELYKSHKGKLDIKHSPDENFVRVYWKR
jgi:hypothetical protein